MKVIPALFFLSVLFLRSFSQDNFNSVNLSGSIHVIDSQYCLISKIVVLDTSNIKIEKHPYINDSKPATVRPHILKIIRGVPVNMETNSLRQPLYNSDSEKYITVDRLHPHVDTIILDNIIPFEIGTYQVQLEMDYYYSANTFTAVTNFIEFNCLFIPPKSIW